MFFRRRTTFVAFKYKSGIFAVIYQKVQVFLAQTGILAAYPEKFILLRPVEIFQDPGPRR